MKRQLLCPPCGRKVYPDFKGEHQKTKVGEAIEDFLCDQCGSKIPQGTGCYAQSLWVDGRGGQYYEWEEEYFLKAGAK